MKRRAVHAYRKGWHPMQVQGETACGLATGRILGQPIGVKATHDRRKVTCKRCKRVQP